MSLIHRISLAAALTILGAAHLPAQTTLPFTIRVQQGTTVTTVNDGSTIALNADAIGLASSATVTVTYRGSTGATINSLDFSGSLDFQITGIPDVPFSLNRDQSFSFSIRYLAANSVRQTARLGMIYSEGRATASFSLNLTGTAPEFAFSYIPQGGNATPLGPDGVITFPQTAIDTPSTTTVVALNRGSGTGNLGAIAVSGAAFTLAGVPLPNTPVEAGRDVRFNVIFTPKQLDPVTGALSVALANSRANFALQGSGQGPVFLYEALQAGAVSPIAPNQTISAPDTRVGETSTMQIRFRNTGNAEARIASIAVQGTGFSLTDMPFLPLTLPVGQSALITLAFNPAQAGRATARLRIGNDTFDVAANALGALLNYSYSVGTGVTTLPASGGTVTLTPVAIGRSGTAQIQVSNTGTTDATINSISVSSSGNVMSLEQVPSLPTTLAAGATLPFTIRFVPTAVGAANGTLRIDNQTFAVVATGTNPAALPDYRFSGAGRTVDPLQQPAISLDLTSPYALRVNGTLTLAFNSDVFANDPSVQFSSGGRTVNFTIPPNSTRAVFPGGSDQIRVQTGTVAGTISLTPTFSTESGIDLTPSGAPQMNIAVAQAAPRITGFSVASKAASTITVLITGYTTARSVTQMDFQFTPVSGQNVQTTRLTVNVEPTFNAWFQNSASQSFGSQFSVSLPLAFAGDVNGSNIALTDTIQSMSVTLTNRTGMSNSASVNVKN